MKSQKNILIAFILNLFFAAFELMGGIFTGSVAILSDAIHDIGDAASIGISYLLERKSAHAADEKYTYGYARYSLLGSLLLNISLLAGSAIVIMGAIERIINPVPINYDGMIIFAVFGVIINFSAALITHKGHSHNQRAVSLHMLEDVLGWVLVLIGAAVMRFTDFSLLDPIMSIAVAVFIIINAIKNLSSSLSPLLEKAPANITPSLIKEIVLEIDGVIDAHHIHIWSADGHRVFLTAHIVAFGDAAKIKAEIKQGLSHRGIAHATLELESPDEICEDRCCHTDTEHSCCHHHHH